MKNYQEVAFEIGDSIALKVLLKWERFHLDWA
jgi:hypothetical protein